MTSQIKHDQLLELQKSLEGTLHFDELMRSLYATDASVYRLLPLAVAYPKTNSDIKKLIAFAKAHKTSLIPRTAGTSLAGQCVGKGIVVDVSKHFTKILDINEAKKTVTVQPGVVRDELNNYLKPSLSCVDQDTNELAKKTFELMKQNIESVDKHKPQQIKITPNLILRETCA